MKLVNAADILRCIEKSDLDSGQKQCLTELVNDTPAALDAETIPNGLYNAVKYWNKVSDDMRGDTAEAAQAHKLAAWLGDLWIRRAKHKRMLLKNDIEEELDNGWVLDPQRVQAMKERIDKIAGIDQQMCEISDLFYWNKQWDRY